MLNHTTYVISKANPLKYMMSKAYHNMHTTKWIMFPSDFDLIFISEKSIKGQVIADQLVEVPIQDTTPLEITLLDEDVFKIMIEEAVDTQEEYDTTMYFDGLRCEQGGGVRFIFFTPQGVPIMYYFKIDFLCTNNNTKYKALILGLNITLELKLEKLLIYEDSQLIVNKILGTYQCHNELLNTYKDLELKLLNIFKSYNIEIAP